MKREQFFKHRLQALSTLQDAVGAMRSLSAHHFRRARQGLNASREYRDEINTVVAEIGIQHPIHVGVPPGLLVIASDLGLCGDYNSRLSHLAVTVATENTFSKVYSVGRRARTALAKNSITPSRLYESPTSLEGLTHLLLGLAQDVLDDYLAKEIGGLQVVSAGFEGVGHFSPLSVQVLPIKPVAGVQPLRRSPYIDDDHLKTVAVREYLYITLYEILLDALAAEHGMRLIAAESALEWLDNTSTTTSRRLANARSEASTQELLDIVSGGRRRLRSD